MVVCVAVSEPVTDRILSTPDAPAHCPADTVSALCVLDPVFIKYWSCAFATPVAYHVMITFPPVPCCIDVPFATQAKAIHPKVSASSWNSIAVLQFTSLNLKIPAVEP